MENMTKERAKEIVAKKYGLGTTLVTGHKASYWEEAMDLVLASGSVAAPKEEIFVDGDFNDSYEARVKRATGKNMIISKEHYTALREALKELLHIAESKFNDLSIDDAHSHRMYIALKAIIERARKLILK